MRIWHYRLLPYLPDAQFQGQLRELVAIMRSWRDKGATNHLLINRATEYPKSELVKYFGLYCRVFSRRYGKNIRDNIYMEFLVFLGADNMHAAPCFDGWHNKEYLRVCMANLYEKHVFGRGASRISDKEWKRLLQGYREITGEDYII